MSLVMIAARAAPAPRQTDLMFDQGAVAVLNKFRLLMARVKCAARLDVFNACAVLGADPTTSTTAYAEALLRVLQQGLGRAPILYHPGDLELSDDEAWLLRVLLSAQSGDEDSLRFLTTRRLSRETLRPTIFLVRNLAARIEEI